MYNEKLKSGEFTSLLAVIEVAVAVVVTVVVVGGCGCGGGGGGGGEREKKWEEGGGKREGERS